MANNITATDPLDTTIVDLLKILPGTWQNFEANRGSAIYEDALTLLVSAGMVEQRRNMRLCIAGYSKMICYTFRGTGKRALRHVTAIIAPVLSDLLKAAGKTMKHVFFETDPVFQMRLTDWGCQAKKDVAADKIGQVLDFIHQRGAFQFRDEVPSSAVVESLEIKDISVQQGGSVAVANAQVNLGEIKIENKINVDTSSLAEMLKDTLKKTTAVKPKAAKKKSAPKPEVDPKRISLIEAENRIELLQKWEEQQKKNRGLARKKKVTLKQFARQMHTSEKLMKSHQAWYRKNQRASDDFPEVVQTIDFRKLKRWFS